MEGRHKLLFLQKGIKKYRENLMDTMCSLPPLSLKSYFGRDGWITFRGKVKKERSQNGKSECTYLIAQVGRADDLNGYWCFRIIIHMRGLGKM